MGEFTFTLGTREAVVPKIALSAASGAGKTTSALMLAWGLIDGQAEEDWENIIVLDSENKRALYNVGRAFQIGDDPPHYLKIGRFQHASIDAPYRPERYIKGMAEAYALKIPNPKKRVVILDSGTDEWEGLGGCLDWHRELGGRDVDWKTVSPWHDAFLEKIRALACPVIVTLLETQKHDIEKYLTQAGAEKHAIRKLGLRPRQREGFERKFDIHLTIEHGTHNASVGAGKDVTGLFSTMQPRPITPEIGQIIANWSKSGADPVGSEGWVAKRCDELRSAASIDALADLFKRTNQQIAGLLTEEYRAMLAKAKDEAKARLMPAAAAPTPK